MRCISKNIPISKIQTGLGILWTLLAGSALHFLYEQSRYHPAAALFSPVNESTWEHLKLLFFPVLFYTLLECIRMGRRSWGFLWARTMALLSGMALIIIGFYTYSGIIGQNNLIADIILFAVSAAAVFILTLIIQKWRRKLPAHTGTALFLLLGVMILFFIFTFYPPQLALFTDPQTHTRGIPIDSIPGLCAWTAHR